MAYVWHTACNALFMRRYHQQQALSQSARRGRRLWAGIAVVGMLLASAARAEFGTEVPMTQASGGTLYVSANAQGVEADFLLDTGAGMVTLSSQLFDQIRQHTPMTPVRQMAARLANNRYQTIDVYTLDSLVVGQCELGPVEVAVMQGSSRNLLGLSALGAAAPFAINLSPPGLTLSHCNSEPLLASAH